MVPFFDKLEQAGKSKPLFRIGNMSSEQTFKKNIAERRIHIRFRPETGAYASFSPDSSMLGQIKDISIGGLAFSYIDMGDPNSTVTNIDIFMVGRKFYMKQVPVQEVQDFQISDDVPFSSVPMRQMSVQFLSLGTDQVSRIEDFINDYTVGTA